MAKLDLDRDYYADLELPGPVDINEVKKQFRKLGMFFATHRHTRPC
jgi:curved DNA-binding protein CbpA